MLWNCSDITVRYRQDDGSQTLALRDVSLSIRHGERVAVVGPNGSGKSTLALLIAGLIEPTSGAITGDAVRLGHPTGAMVFQSPDDNLLGETVREELEMCLEHAGANEEAGDTFESALTRFGLEEFADRSTSQLSGGEKQIVALACAIASGRKIIVLDEPTSHLDPPGKRMLWEFLRAVAVDSAPSPAIVVVTQYPDEVSHFNRLVVLDAGTIIYDGVPSNWRGPKSAATSVMSFPPLVGFPPILSTRDLGQVAMPGWPMPQNPIRNVSVDIHPGEAIALCGPIGAGKTTLALLLAGLLPRHTGQRAAQGESPVMLIQYPERQLYCKTVEDEVAAGQMSRGVPKADAMSRAHRALELMGLSPQLFAKRDPFSVSGGQKRRVMLAAASVLDAPLYILDEPQAALDDDGLSAIRAMCAGWLQRGASYILISHDLSFLKSLTSRVLVLNRGEMLFDGHWKTMDESSNLLSAIGFD